MKKTIVIFASALCLSGVLASNALSQQPENLYPTMIGLTAASYQIPDGGFAEVYGSKAQLIYGLNLSQTILHYRGWDVDLSLEGRTYSRSGASTLDQTSTKFSMTPISLAARVLYETKYVVPFLGAGADWYSFKETSDLASTNGTATGWHFQTGAYVVIPGLDFLRVKIYYKFTRVKALQNEIEADLGGNEYGIGLSFGFNLLNKGAVSD